ncbi:hypothetical protein FPV67DRAFT_1029045 [Lyophyllum atratum]|nr:hypothetical protein FPV67DRAFT_1029045 [Lyophyllum atratum]
MKSIANPTPESDHLKEAKSAGIVQRMKTRSTKSITNSSKTRDTQNATQTPRARFAEPSQEVPDSAARRTRAATRRQTLGTVTPSILPANLGRQSRLIRVSGPAQSIEDSNGVAAPSSNSQEAMSLDTWATLKPSSPDVESTMMVDELEPSSPPLSTCMDVDNPKRNGASQDGPAKNPLFILTESQPAISVLAMERSVSTRG